MSPEQKVSKAIQLVRKYVPDFEIISKPKSRLHRFIGKLLFFNKGYMTSFYTTIRNKTARPLGGYSRDEWVTILHEGMHALDSSRMHGIFEFWYLMPQLLGVFGIIFGLLGALLWPGFFWGMFFLLFSAPIPALGRAWLEFRAYKINVITYRVLYSGIPDILNDILNHYVTEFTGPNYYFMFPFKKTIRRRFDKWAERIEDGSSLDYDVKTCNYYSDCELLAKELKYQ